MAQDDGIAWGVDSADPVTSAAWDAAYNLLGRLPKFWGRYVGGDYAVTAAEIAYLHEKNCKVLIAYNDTGPDDVAGDSAAGAADANAAIAAMKALGVPAGVYVYADIEAGWSPSVAWLDGWVSTLSNSEYGAGLYGNPDADFGPAYDEAYAGAPEHFARTRIWSSEPEPYDGSECGQPPPATFAPDTPNSNPQGTVVWQYVENCTAAAVDCDLATAAGLATMW